MVRLALIGCGKIGKVHADSIAAHPRAELAWACHPREQAARVFAREYGANASTDVDAVLADPSVDAILVASPTSTHVDLITRGVLAGKAVLCEKPIDLDITRVDACCPQREREPGGHDGLQPPVRLLVPRSPRPDPRRRHRPARTADHHQPGSRPHRRRATSAAPAGLFRDMTIHDFDMARFLARRGRRGPGCRGELHHSEEIAEVGDIDSASIMLRGADGALCQIVNSRRCASRLRPARRGLR